MMANDRMSFVDSLSQRVARRTQVRRNVESSNSWRRLTDPGLCRLHRSGRRPRHGDRPAACRRYVPRPDLLSVRRP